MSHNMTFFGKNVLFIGAHPDDIELGCGALLYEIKNETNIICYTLSDNQNNPELKNLVEEHYNSMAVLGLKKEQVILDQFPTRRFPDFRQEILEKFIQLNRMHQPEIIFVHTQQDIHQDHSTVTQEAMRAFRGTTVLGFDVLRSSFGFFPHFLVEVSPLSVEMKVKALAEYKTYKDRYYFHDDVVRSTAIRHGALAERPYAEGFDIIRIVGNFGK